MPVLMVECVGCGKRQEDVGRSKTCIDCGLQPLPSYSYPKDSPFYPHPRQSLDDLVRQVGNSTYRGRH